VVAIDEHPEGCNLTLRVHAGARRNAVEAGVEAALKVSVTQSPEKGKANKAVVALLAKELGLRKSQLEIISGHTSPQKRLLVRAISFAELGARLRSALEGR